MHGRRRVVAGRGRASGATAVVVVLLAATAVFGAARADFLIVEDPSALSVLDGYEQTLDAVGRKALLPYAPFEIVERRVTLGDRITEAMRCRYRGETCYLLRDENGKLLGLSRCGYYKKFSGTRVPGDTVVVTRDKAVSLARRYPAAGTSEYLDRGDQVVRVFAYGNRLYVRVVGHDARYGWCARAAARGWEPLAASAKREAVLTEALAGRIIDRFSAANEAYAEYFSHFNAVTGTTRPIPRWESGREDNRLRFTLARGADSGQRLQRSTAVLIGDVRNLLLGKPFAVEQNNETIMVRPVE
jgi:hypothetical protein